MLRLVAFLTLFVWVSIARGQNVDFDRICLVGEAYLDSLMYDRATEVFKKGVHLCQETGDLTNEGYFLIDLGYIFQQTDDLKSALEYYEKARVIGEQVENDNILASSYLNLGIIYRQRGIYEQAMPLLLKSIHYSEKVGNYEFLSSAYNTLGNIQNNLNHFSLALGHYTDALKYGRQRMADPSTSSSSSAAIDIASSLANIAVLYKNYKQYDSAMSYLSQALNMTSAVVDTQFISNTVATRGEIYLLQGQMAEARRAFEESLQLSKKGNYRAGIANTAVLLADIYLKAKDYGKAKLFAMEGIMVAREDSFEEPLLKGYDVMRKIAKLEHQFERASTYDELYIGLNDLLFNERSRRSIDEMEARFENDKNEEKIESIQKVAKERMKFYWFGMGLLMIIIVFIIRAYLQKRREKERMKKENERIEADNKKIEMLMRELNHRVKNNLQLLSSMLNVQILQMEDSSTKDVLLETEGRLRAMVVVHKRLYMDKDLTLIDVPNFIIDLIDDLKTSYGRPDVCVETKLMEFQAQADTAIVLGLMINEILTNAFKYAFVNNPKPQLDVTMRLHDSSIELIIQDNGPGFNVEEITDQTFGFRLITIFCEQLNCKFTYERIQGMRVTITIV